MDDLQVTEAPTQDSSEISDNSGPDEPKGGQVVDPSENTPRERTDPKEKPEPQQDPLRATKHKIKANNKEEELDYDTLLKRAELATGAYQRFDEADKIRKEYESKAQKLSSDKIEDLLDVIPLDRLLEISSQIEKTRLELQGLSQDQIDDMLYRQEAEAAKAKLKQIEDEKVQSERQAQSAQAFQIIEQEIGDVLEYAKGQGVPLADLPDVGVEIVDELLGVLSIIEEEEKAGRRYTGKIPTAKDAFEMIQKRYQQRLDTYLKKHRPDSLLSMLTPEQQKALRQASLDTLYGDNPRPGVQQRNEFQAPQPSPERMSIDDYFKQKEKTFGVRR